MRQCEIYETNPNDWKSKLGTLELHPQDMARNRCECARICFWSYPVKVYPGESGYFLQSSVKPGRMNAVEGIPAKAVAESREKALIRNGGGLFTTAASRRRSGLGGAAGPGLAAAATTPVFL